MMETVALIVQWLLIGGMTLAGIKGAWDTFFRQR